MQNREDLAMELVHNVHVVALTCIMRSSVPGETLPVVGVELHEVLPASKILLWWWKRSSVLQVSIHPKEIISDQLEPVVIRVEQTAASRIRALIQKPQMSKSTKAE